jgi:hypothetical protein
LNASAKAVPARRLTASAAYLATLFDVVLVIGYSGIGR